jgi:chromodomain-helicase-DNA-binding protein 1
MSSTTSLPYANGHSSPLQNATLTNDDAPYDSESDLSEVAIPNVDEPSPATTANNRSEFGAQDTDESDASAEEAQEASDADFDMEDSPAPQASNNGRQDRSTSAESHRPAKRKVGLEDDEHIQANPELYGLRRSVRVLMLPKKEKILTQFS